MDQVVEERFRATRGLEVDPETDQPGYTIDIEFLGGLSESQKTLFKDAAKRWSKIITGDVPSVTVDGKTIDDILIRAKGEKIDGPGKVLGRAGPNRVRSKTFLPATASMTFDTDDLPGMEKDGRLGDVIAHEMGHCIGIGTIWDDLKLVDGAGTKNPTFNGKGAQKEYGTLRGDGKSAPVPVENEGGPGTADSHWRDTLFGNEMMTGYIAKKGNPISRLTAAALSDMGYTVDLAAAEAYSIPKTVELLERAVPDGWEMVGTDYEVLPEAAED